MITCINKKSYINAVSAQDHIGAVVSKKKERQT